jgi:hypothetical protein
MIARFRVGRLPMIRISLPYIYGLATELEPLSSLPDDKTPIRDVMFTLLIAENAINTLATATIYVSYLRTSYELSHKLLSAIKRATERHETESEIGRHELWDIKITFNQYKIALLAELGSFNVYFVTQKGGFDMFSLLGAGEALFPSDLSAKVPEAIVDAREAAKALAYEVPTSCGFHVFRVTESVLRKY